MTAGPSAPRANVVWLDEVDSTVSFCERLMSAWADTEAAPLPETVVAAAAQTRGRGRGAHEWSSPPGGLYANWMAWLPTAQLAVLPMAIGVALAAAVEALVRSVEVGLKWPNDLVAGGRKLGGILCHSRAADESAWVSVGFGINVARAPLPTGGGAALASLEELGWRGAPGDAVEAILESFLGSVHPALEDRPGTRRLWEARSVHRPGDPMRLHVGREVVTGGFAGFDADGGLRLEVEGRVRTFSVGDLVVDAGGGG